MKKMATCFLFFITYYFSSVAMALECSDLNGAWRGQLGELTVAFDINISGSSSIQYSKADGGGLVGGVGSSCQIRDGVPSLWIWHQVGNDKGTDWYIRVIVDGNLNNQNELTIKKFEYVNRSGTNASGSGVLYK